MTNLHFHGLTVSPAAPQELAEPHWYGYLLHNLYAARLRAELFFKGDERVVAINTPWRLRDA